MSIFFRVSLFGGVVSVEEHPTMRFRRRAFARSQHQHRHCRVLQAIIRHRADEESRERVSIMRRHAYQIRLDGFGDGANQLSNRDVSLRPGGQINQVWDPELRKLATESRLYEMFRLGAVQSSSVFHLFVEFFVVRLGRCSHLRTRASVS
jgi:hypothetical protein